MTRAVLVDVAVVVLGVVASVLVTGVVIEDVVRAIARRLSEQGA